MISTKNRIISAFVAISVLAMTSGLPEAVALPTPPSPPSINIIPNITSVALVNGVLTATGTATAVVHGRTVTVPFSAPLDVTALPNPGDPCAILNLQLGPINLNLLGLVVQTSPICLNITGFANGGLLGQLLCGLANALNNGIPLVQYLESLPPDQLNTLLTGITDILNGALSNLYNATLTSIDSICSGPGTPPGHHRTCAILHLELGPLNLTILGLNVVLDNCTNGPVTVDITAVRGALLGNLLCELLGHNLINLGATLQDILNLILARLH
jgi:hypothetical protein